MKAEDAEADRIGQVLHGQRGVDALSRGQSYRQAGWSRFDADAQPCSRDEIARERQLYGETRTFGGGDNDRYAIGSDTGADDGASRPIPGTPDADPLRRI